jgi:DNA-binding YbaB/EbfC family protein
MAMSNPQGTTAGGPYLGQIVEQAQRMQAALATAQQELADARVQGSAGGGLVTATVNGSGELLDLVITEAAVDPDDMETLADLVVAAVRDATANASKLATEKMDAVTGGVGGMLGGLGGMLGGPGGGGPGGLGGLGGLGGFGGGGSGVRPGSGLPGGSGHQPGSA